jgi:uncharacterized RDD family membrane protein YckC
MKPRRRQGRLTSRTALKPLGATHQLSASASLPRRLAALLYDWLLLIGVLFAATLAVLALRGGQALPAHNPWFTAYLIATGMGFFSWFWTHGGETLGMRAWKLRLVSLDGLPIQGRQALIRSSVALLGASALGLGYLWVLLDPQGRAWQDIASGTRVVTTATSRGKSG